MKRWAELADDFRRVAFARGVEIVADAIPADRATVYRLLNGVTQHPTRAIRAGVERVVRENQAEEKTA